MESKEEYVFFYGHTGPSNGKLGPFVCSQFYPRKFVDDEDGTEYCVNEKYMMTGKARLFKDEETAKRILECNDPHRIKALGRTVKGFNERIWAENREEIVFRGNWMKFSQNKDLADYLLSTGNKILVEASPGDRIWGIGFKANEAMENKSRWGLNLLGKALMRVRDQLRKQASS